MSNQEQRNIRSDEVQDILGSPPKWIVQWGTTAIIIGVILLAFVGYLIKYADVIEGPITISTEQKPIEILASKAGKLGQILVNEEGLVEEGNLIFVLDNSLSYDSYQELEFKVIDWQTWSLEKFLNTAPPAQNDLADLQIPYNKFITSWNNLKNTPRPLGNVVNGNNQINQQQILRLKNRLDDLDYLVVETQGEYKNAVRKLEVAKSNYAADASPDQYSKLSRASDVKIALEKELDDLNGKIANAKDELSIYLEQENKTQTLNIKPPNYDLTDLNNALLELQSALENWRNDHLVFAPVGGTIVFAGDNLGLERYYEENEKIVTLIPFGGDKIVGKLLINSGDLRSVTLDDYVMIRLDISDPDTEGIIEGIVTGKGVSQNEDKMYEVKIGLPNGLVTNRGVNIKFNPKLHGQASIVTKEKRFLERLLEQVKTILA